MTFHLHYVYNESPHTSRICLLMLNIFFLYRIVVFLMQLRLISPEITKVSTHSRLFCCQFVVFTGRWRQKRAARRTLSMVLKEVRGGSITQLHLYCGANTRNMVLYIHVCYTEQSQLYIY